MILTAYRPYCQLRPTRSRWLWATAILPSVVAGFHELLPAPSTWKPPTNDLSKVLEQVGVKKIFFLRHGQTAKSETGVDFDRYLTDIGREQSRIAGESFGKNTLLPFYPKVLVSPAPRTVETAELFLKAAIGDDDSYQNNMNLVPIQDLYDKTMQPAGSKLFAKIGYAPLNAYLNACDEHDRAVARDLLGKYAGATIDAIHRTLSGDLQAAPLRSSTLLVVGHAIYLPAAVLGSASVLGTSSADDLQIVLFTNTKEAEGYMFNVASNEVDYLSRPTSV